MHSDNSLSLWDLVSAGYSLRLLSTISSGTPISPVGEYDLGILEHCRILLDLIDKLSLERCDRVVGKQLRVLVDELEDELVRNDAAIMGSRTSKLRIVIADLQMALVREGSGRQIVAVLPARQIEVEELLADPARWFGLTFGQLLQATPSILADFQEAAHSFAFGFAPSAIVFTLRATEGLVKVYYAKLIGKAADEKPWGPLISDMRKSPKRCPEQLLSRLDGLRVIRNEAMHAVPRNPLLWGDGGARQVLIQCREIVQDMVRDVEDRNL